MNQVEQNAVNLAFCLLFMYQVPPSRLEELTSKLPEGASSRDLGKFDLYALGRYKILFDNQGRRVVVCSDTKERLGFVSADKSRAEERPQGYVKSLWGSYEAECV